MSVFSRDVTRIGLPDETASFFAERDRELEARLTTTARRISRRTTRLNIPLGNTVVDGLTTEDYTYGDVPIKTATGDSALVVPDTGFYHIQCGTWANPDALADEMILHLRTGTSVSATGGTRMDLVSGNAVASGANLYLTLAVDFPLTEGDLVWVVMYSSVQWDLLAASDYGPWLSLRLIK